MKKYIYPLFILTSVSFAYSQTETSESKIIILQPMVSCCSDGDIGIFSGCRQECTIFITGIKTRNSRHIESSEIIADSSKDSRDQSTSLESHNFVEDPAIIYPNPVKDIMNIKSTDPITVIEILNIHGELEQIMNPREEQLDVSNLPVGIYYVRIYFENKKTVQVEKIEIVK